MARSLQYPTARQSHLSPHERLVRCVRKLQEALRWLIDQLTALTRASATEPFAALTICEELEESGGARGRTIEELI